MPIHPTTADPIVGDPWSIYNVTHTIGYVFGTGWTPACDMRMTKWTLRMWGEYAGPPSDTDRRCEYCEAGVQNGH